MNDLETRPKTDEALPPLGVGDKIILGPWLYFNVIPVAAPLIGGFFGAYFVYGSDVVSFGLVPWTALIMVGLLLACLVITHLIELVLRRNMAPRHAMLREVVSTIIGLAVMALLCRIVFLGAAAAWVAAVIASLLLLACMPLVKLPEKRAPDTR